MMKHKGCGDSAASTPYRLLVLKLVFLMTNVILIQISGLTGYPSIILSLPLEARDRRDNCLEVFVY